MKNLYKSVFLASLLGLTGFAYADVDTITGIGSTRLEACTDAKNSAREVNMPNNFMITGFAPCECERSGSSFWKCVVEYSFYYRKTRR